MSATTEISHTSSRTLVPASESSLSALADVAAWIWPRRHLLLATLRASQAARPARPQPPRKLRFACEV
jgi:hypothetical protein